MKLPILVSIFEDAFRAALDWGQKIYPLREISCSVPFNLYLAESSCNLEVLLPENGLFPFTGDKSVYWMDYLDDSNCFEKIRVIISDVITIVVCSLRDSILLPAIPPHMHCRNKVYIYTSFWQLLGKQFPICRHSFFWKEWSC